MSEQIDIPIRQVREAQVECKISKIPGHGVVDRTPGKDHLRVVADLFCLLDKVVGVNRDTMAADHAGLVGMEVPPGAGSPEHFLGAEAQKGEDYQELVHERDVEVPLDVPIGEYLMEIVGFQSVNIVIIQYLQRRYHEYSG